MSCEPSRAMNGDSVAVELIFGEWKNEVKAGLEESDEELEANFIQDVAENESLKRQVRFILDNDLTPRGHIRGVLKR